MNGRLFQYYYCVWQFTQNKNNVSVVCSKGIHHYMNIRCFLHHFLINLTFNIQSLPGDLQKYRPRPAPDLSCSETIPGQKISFLNLSLVPSRAVHLVINTTLSQYPIIPVTRQTVKLWLQACKIDVRWFDFLSVTKIQSKLDRCATTSVRYQPGHFPQSRSHHILSHALAVCLVNFCRDLNYSSKIHTMDSNI